eukprot:TRINITY_DN9527_c0_g2_i1.p1 TRINITY_DN9527_c0_g2~~TRINITY_DN9527_c0_g2_i1.p1  ORF type:complete len:559 (-),score=147.54 TRINITY_DN9527_c0_g2_i1:147-1823(-)
MLDMLSSVSTIDTAPAAIVNHSATDNHNNPTLKSFQKYSTPQQIKSNPLIDSGSVSQLLRGEPQSEFAASAQEPPPPRKENSAMNSVECREEKKEEEGERKTDALAPAVPPSSEEKEQQVNAEGIAEKTTKEKEQQKVAVGNNENAGDGKSADEVEENNKTNGKEEEKEEEETGVVPPVEIRVQCSQTQFGESVFVVGEWINWDANRAIKLEGSQWPIWKGTFSAQRITGTEYKYYILGADGKTKVWESIPKGNRLFTGRRKVEDIFGNPLNEEEAIEYSKTVDYPIPIVDLAKSQFRVIKAAYKGVLAAMKIFPMDSVKAIKQAMNEAQTLACMDHSCIVRIYCAYYDKSDDVVVIVEEYMNRGSLSTLLYTEHFQMNVVQKLRILLRLTRAIEYIHSLGFIHRDIKSPNVLLDKELDAKLCDFGITRKEASIFDKMTKIGTPLWMAPEVFMSKHYDCKADIYSLGVVMYEVMEHELPSDRLDHHSIRPNQNCLAPLIKQCLDLVPSNRPTATDVKVALQTTISDQCKRILSMRNIVATRENLIQAYEQYKVQNLNL